MIGATKGSRISLSDIDGKPIHDTGYWNITPLLVLHIYNNLCPSGYIKRIGRSLDMGYPGHFESSPFSKRNYTPHIMIK